MTDELTALRTENAELKARLAIQWDGVANERDALRKENNELRDTIAKLKATEAAHQPQRSSLFVTSTYQTSKQSSPIVMPNRGDEGRSLADDADREPFVMPNRRALPSSA